MANNDATVIVGKLSDEELQKSIDKLVSNIATANDLIRKDFDHTINHIQKSFKSLGDIKVSSGGASDGGSSRRSSVLKQEEQQVRNLTTSYDNFAKAQQVAVRTPNNNYRNADTLETMKIQLELLRQRLIETRQQYSSFVALAANATRTGDEGLYKFATSNVHAFEAEAKNLIQQIRGVQNAVQQMGDVIAPQGHLIQNWVASIGKVDPALKQLGDQIKNNSLLSKQSAHATTQATNEEVVSIQKRLEAERQAMQQNKAFYQNIRDNIKETGIKAQETSQKIIKSMYDQLSSNQTEPIRGLKELHEAIVQMRRAYFDMDVSARNTPLGVALDNDIKKAQEALKEVQKYNRELSGIKFIGKDTIGSNLRSYDELSNTLKTIINEYKQLNKAERDAAKGTELLNKIHAFQREIRDVQRTMNRPTSLKKALGLDESTLDHINDKLQALRAYKGGLKITDPKQLEEMKQVDAEINRIQKDYDKLMAKNQQMIASNTALGRSWNYMKNRLAFYFSVGASTQFIKNLIEVRSQYEMNERALGILIGSAERGTEIFQQLSQMALVSPYTLIELSSAAKQLTAYDIAAKDVVDTTRRLADMASAVGVPMERLTYALGQIKAYGYLNSRDARMFANAGIPLVKQLSEYYTQLEGKMVSVGDVYDRMKKKAIDFNSVMAVVTKMTDEGGKFFDFQAKMADTLKVRLANLTLAWNNMLNEMGAETQGVLTTGINLLKTLFLQWKNINAALSNIGWAVGIRTAIMLIVWAAINAGKAIGLWNKEMALSAVVGKRLAGILTTLARSLATIATSRVTWLAVIAMAAIDAYNGLMGVNKAMEQLNSSLRKAAEDNYNNITKFIEQYKNLKDSLYEQMEIPIGETGKYAQVQVAKDIDQGEAKKAWEAIREEIELTTRNSEEYIGNLLTIENISERVRQGFAVLEDLKVVNAALKDIGDDTIKIDNDFEILFFNIKDGLVTNLKDLKDYENGIIKLYGSVDNARKKFEGLDRALWSTAWQDYNREVENLRKNIETTTRSILDFIELKGWSGDVGKINEVFKQITDKIVLDNQLDPQKAFMLQEQVEEARSKAAKAALVARINDEAAAYRAAQDKNAKEAILIRYNELKEEYDTFEQFNGKSRVYWTNFTKWLKEQHLSEMTEMFRGMDAEQIKSINFQEGKYREWVNRMVTKYAKEHKMSYDDAFSYLKNWVTRANKWSIFIPLTISTEDKKSVLKTLEEADAAYESAKKNIERLEIRKKQLEEKGATTNKAVKDQTEDDKELIQLEQELIAEQKSLADAEAKGGRSKKEAAEARRAQRQAESELQKALKEEMQLIDKVRSSYKKLIDDSVNHEEALSISTDGFEKSVAEINKTLSKFGVKKIDLSKFAGITNPQELVNLLQDQLNTLLKSSAVKPVEIQDFEAKIRDLKLDAKSYNQKTFAESLNNSLSKLKDEYELAVALDADPELGNTFAEMMGINPEDLPHTVQEYADEYTKYLNKYLNENGSKLELPHLNLTDDDLRMFEEMVKENKLNANLYEKIAAAVKDVREKTNKDISETIKNWDKLIEKYGEYEAKVKAIQNNSAQERVGIVNKAGTKEQKSAAVRLLTKLQAEEDPQERNKLEDELKALVTEVAQKDSSLLKIAVAIDNNQLNATATEAFNKFKESGIWEVATSNLSGMTNNAIDGLIKSLETFKKENKGLDTKKVREIDRVIKSLRKQQREGNPFLAIGNAMDEAKERATALKPELDKVAGQIKELEDKRESGVELSKEEEKELKTLKDRWKELSDAGNLSATEIVGFINQCTSAASQAIAMFNDMVGALSGNKWNEAQEILGDVASTIDKAGQGAATGAQVGGGWGALIGGVAGGVMGAITAFADNGNKKITASIKESETAVKRLENAYKDLQYAIDDAYGTAKYGAEEAAIANKKLQLAELKRQLELSKSRTGKHRDEDEIESLKGQVIDLEQEINKATNDIVNDLLDISSVGSAAEEVVSAMIESFRNGEDYMKSFGNKFSDMIDNMIMKSIVSKVIGQRMEQMFAEVDEMTKGRAFGAQANIDSISTQMKKNESRLAELEKYRLYMETQAIAFSPEDYQQWLREIEEINQENVKLKKELQEAQGRYADAIAITPEDAGTIRERVDSWKDNVKSEFENWMEAFGISFGDKKESAQLSALQQGISGITETTAGAIEAYMNGVSQQVYLHSDLLMQIRDAVVGFSMDVQLGAMSQILMQLQMNYQIAESIHSMMSGWNNPAGNAMRVELI